MKFDYSTNPPKAWKVEDGDWVPEDPQYVIQCKVCQKWFVKTNLFNDSDICSAGCKLRKSEVRT